MTPEQGWVHVLAAFIPPEPEVEQSGMAAVMERLEKLEKALSDHMAENRKDDSFNPDPMSNRVEKAVRKYFTRMSTAAYDTCSITIDLDASPKDLPFEIALAYMKAGRKVKRLTWDLISKRAQHLEMMRKNGTGYSYVAMCRPDEAGEGLSSCWQPLGTDLAENDWEVIKEQAA